MRRNVSSAERSTLGRVAHGSRHFVVGDEMLPGTSLEAETNAAGLAPRSTATIKNGGLVVSVTRTRRGCQSHTHPLSHGASRDPGAPRDRRDPDVLTKSIAPPHGFSAITEYRLPIILRTDHGKSKLWTAPKELAVGRLS